MTTELNRFSHTVENYQRYRPGYPAALMHVLKTKAGLTPEKVIADIGSGTGLLTKLFLDNGNCVYGIEPNALMRAAGEKFLEDLPLFTSIAGQAEQTKLPDSSVDFIVVGTAFHWFDVDKSKIEFFRILRQPGWAALIWNVRNVDASFFMQAYEALISTYGSFTQEKAARQFDQVATAAFFAPFEMQVVSIPHKQVFDWMGLHGRLLSTSYALKPEEALFADMIHGLRRIFDKFQKNGTVEFLYLAKMYFGQMK